MNPWPINLKQIKFNSIYLTQPLFNACFYGLKSIFVLYIVSQYALPESQVISLFATFMSLCYGTSLMGGYFADHGLGVKNAVILGGIFTILGLFCILIPSQDLCFLGLALLSLGSGLFKPNLLTAVGLIFENPKDPEKDKAYSIIYVIGNIGTFIVPVLCGFVGKIFGWIYSILLVAGIFMSATYLVCKTMRFHTSYKRQIATYSQGRLWGGILSIIPCLYLLIKYRESFHGMMGLIACGSMIYLAKIIYQCQPEQRRDVVSVIFHIFLFALFCTLFEQSGSSFLLFLEKAVNRHVMGMVLPSSSILSLEPLFVLLWSPVLIFLSSRYLEKTKPIDGLVKMGCGFMFVAVSFLILTLGAYQNSGISMPLMWVIGAIFMQTVGELWIVPISLSKISQYSPPHLQSIMMSFWPMAIAYGHYFAGFIAQYSIGAPTTSEGLFEHYRTFFSSLGGLSLFIGLLVLICQGIRPRILPKVS